MSEVVVVPTARQLWKRSVWGETGDSAMKIGPSRLPKHKCATAENDPKSALFRRIEFDRSARTTRLGTKPGLSLREEAVEEIGGDRRSRSWAEVTREWRDWLREAEETAAVFEAMDPESGEELERTVPLENRFMKARQRRLYAKMHDLERGVRTTYGDGLSTVMLTFTASNRSGAGDWWRCPANHLDDLLGSWPAVRRQLHRVLDGRRWEYARILEPHASGYAHVHLAVFVDGAVRAEMFEPVMRAHVEHCLPAAWDAHAPETDAVAVNRDVSNVAAYLSSYLMKWDESALEAPEQVQRFNALLWATGRRRWSVSQGAQEMMAFEPPSSDLHWKMSYVEIRGERYPIEDGGGDVVVLQLGEEGAGLDPPPDAGGALKE